MAVSQLKPVPTRGQLATTSWTLPGSATTTTLFTVAGNIMLKTLIGRVTTAIGSTATTLSIGLAPTTGTASTVGLASATAITSSEAGTWVGLGATAGAALIVGGAHGAGAAAGYGQLTGPSAPVTVSPGTITLTTSANAGGGVITWYLDFEPLDNYASVSY